MSLRELILASGEAPPVAVTTPGWQCPRVWVRVMTAVELMEYYDAISQDGREAEHRGELLCRCLSDERGARLFADGDAASLNAMPHTLTREVHHAAARLNRLTSDAQDDAVKNSDGRRSGFSETSPSGSE